MRDVQCYIDDDMGWTLAPLMKRYPTKYFRMSLMCNEIVSCSPFCHEAPGVFIK